MGLSEASTIRLLARGRPGACGIQGMLRSWMKDAPDRQDSRARRGRGRVVDQEASGSPA